MTRSVTGVDSSSKGTSLSGTDTEKLPEGEKVICHSRKSSFLIKKIERNKTELAARPEMTQSHGHEFDSSCSLKEAPPGELPQLKCSDPLTRETEVLKDIKTSEEELLHLKEEGCAGLCKICMVNERNISFLPCGHLITCERCSYSLKKCPCCRKLIEGQLKIFMS